MGKFGGGKKKHNGNRNSGRFRTKQSSSGSSHSNAHKRGRRDNPYHEKPVSKRPFPSDEHDTDTRDNNISSYNSNKLLASSNNKKQIMHNSSLSSTKQKNTNTQNNSSIDNKQAYNAFLRLLRKDNNDDDESDNDGTTNEDTDNGSYDDDNTSDSEIEHMNRYEGEEDDNDDVEDDDDDDDDNDDDDIDEDGDEEEEEDDDDVELPRTKEDKSMLKRKPVVNNTNNTTLASDESDDNDDNTGNFDTTINETSLEKDIFYIRYIKDTTNNSSTTTLSTTSNTIPHEYEAYQPIHDNEKALQQRKENLNYETIDIPSNISSTIANTTNTNNTTKINYSYSLGLSTLRLYSIKSIQLFASSNFYQILLSTLNTLNNVSSTISSSSSSNVLVPPKFEITKQQQYTINIKLLNIWLQTYGKEPELILDNQTKTDLLSVSTANSLSASTTPVIHHPFTPLQYFLFPSMFSYGDIYFSCRTLDNARELRTLSILHILNHILKARDIITDHDQKVREAHIQIQKNKLAKEIIKDQQKEKNTKNNTNNTKTSLASNTSSSTTSIPSSTIPPSLVQVPEYHDQGYTRARVLVLLPLRHTALQFIRTILRLLPHHQVMNRARFFKEFSSEDSIYGSTEDSSNDNENTPMDTKHYDNEMNNNSTMTVSKIMNLLPLKTRQMLSDDENDEVTIRDHSTILDNNDDTTNTSVPVINNTNLYPFNIIRQGWPKGLRERYQQERQYKALHGNNDSDDDAFDEDEESQPQRNHRSTQGKPKKRRRDDRTTRDAKKMAAESILGSTEAIENAKRQAEKLKRKAQKAKEAKQKHPPPADWERTFAGNIDDDFRIGISINRKNIRLYSPFYESDILIASPLGLRRIIGGEGEHSRETDFLSSIEITIIDQADMMLHQNWNHLLDIFQSLNNRPTRPGDTDFSRVREVYLTECQKYLRQTIIFSNYLDTDINTLFRKYNYNTLGGIMIRSNYLGTISQVIPSIRQTFTRIPVNTLSEIDDLRFQYFQNKILPEIIQAQQQSTSTTSTPTGLSNYTSHLLIYIPSYFDYVRIRNALDNADIEFVTCSEYSEDKDISRARNRFGRGLDPIMLITERFHYFRRLRIHGIHHILFYSPPLESHFYSEFLNWIEDVNPSSVTNTNNISNNTNNNNNNTTLYNQNTNHSTSVANENFNVSSTCLFTKYDNLALERIVGTQRVQRMVAPDNKPSFVFV